MTLAHNLELFSPFIRGKSVEMETKTDCVVYIRVSTKKQMDKYSPEVQLEGCLQYAQKQKWNVIEVFQSHESAKSDDDRKEFQRMLKFLKKNKRGNIGYILVYAVDRFSRTGVSGAFISEQLQRESNIRLVSILSPADTTTPSGRLQQNIQFVFGQFENDLRRERCVGGMIAKLKQGYWLGTTPHGYDLKSSGNKQVLTINERGKLLKLAFEWKAQGHTDLEIREKLKARGWSIPKQTLHYIFRNVFYCGLISHSLLKGELIEGKHPPIVSKENFLKINGINQQNKYAQHKKEFTETPLQHFVKCMDCGKPFTGYMVKKRLKSQKLLFFYYYKCRTTGCRCNKNAEILNEKFIDVLSEFSIPKLSEELLKKQVSLLFYEVNKDRLEVTESIKKSLDEVKKNIEKVERKFILDEIDRTTKDKYMEEFIAEKNSLMEKLRDEEIDISNLDETLSIAAKLSTQLVDLWKVNDYSAKVQIQKLLFPEGIFYDRKLEAFRTNRINSVFELIHSISGNYGVKKKGRSIFKYRPSEQVTPSGFEPETYCLEGSCSIQLSYGVKLLYPSRTLSGYGVKLLYPSRMLSGYGVKLLYPSRTFSGYGVVIFLRAAKMIIFFCLSNFFPSFFTSITACKPGNV